jgi:hypothetical protein
MTSGRNLPPIPMASIAAEDESFKISYQTANKLAQNELGMKISRYSA